MKEVIKQRPATNISGVATMELMRKYWRKGGGEKSIGTSDFIKKRYKTSPSHKSFQLL